MHHETLPLIFRRCELTLGRNEISGHGRRMRRVLARFAGSSQANYLQAICFMVDRGAVSTGMRLCANLTCVLKTLRGFWGLERVVVTCPEDWDGEEIVAFKEKVEEELCRRRVGRRICVKTRSCK